MGSSGGRLRKRIVAVIAAIAASSVLALVPGTSAQAAGTVRCQAQQKTLTATMATVWLDVCVASDGGSGRNAFIRNIWWEVKANNDNTFYYARFQIRLERYDADYKVAKCDFTWDMNHLRRPGGDTRSTCSAGKITTSLRNGWTGDGYLEYDVVGDGVGRRTWQFTGSPMIY